MFLTDEQQAILNGEVFNDYSDYKMLSDKSEDLAGVCREICALKDMVKGERGYKNEYYRCTCQKDDKRR